MILLFIILLSLLQLTLYHLNDKYKFKFPKILILILFLLGYYLVFPKFFVSILIPNDIKCGMPALGVFLGFWVVGSIAGIATHILWIIKLQSKRTIKE